MIWIEQRELPTFGAAPATRNKTGIVFSGTPVSRAREAGDAEGFFSDGSRKTRVRARHGCAGLDALGDRN